MGTIAPCWSNPSDLSFCNFSQSSPADLSVWNRRGDGQECSTNSAEIHGASGFRRRRMPRWSSSLPFGIAGGLGCWDARLELRFTSLKGSTDIERRPFNLSRRWYIYKSRVICAARKEEDSGRQERSYLQEVDVADHYKVLGLRRHATTSAIKLAYRQLARQLHPDVNKDLDANERFMSVRLAYEVLSDETRRKFYDRSLQEQVKASRRKQVYQQRERDVWSPSRPTKSQYRRTPHETKDWSYSVYPYESEYSNMERHHYTNSTSATFSNIKKKPSRNYSSRGKPREEADLEHLDLQRIGREALLFLWVVSALWHALGAQTALGLLVSALALWKDFGVGYRLASGVAWLMGGEKGLALMVALIGTTRVFGKEYHAVAAVVALALWLGGGVLKAFPLPHGAILVLVYKCIQLQSSM